MPDADRKAEIRAHAEKQFKEAKRDLEYAIAKFDEARRYAVVAGVDVG